MNNGLLSIAACLIVSWGCGHNGPDKADAEFSVWAVNENPIVDIEGAGPDDPIQNVVGATRLSDGSIAIADSYASAVRFFSAEGRHLRRTGRGGSGPGEFANISWLGQCGRDSVFVWDYMHHRMTVLDRHGTTVRTFKPIHKVGTITCSRAGTLVALLQVGGAAERNQPRIDSARVVLLNRLGRDSVFIRTVAAWEQRILGRLAHLVMAEPGVYFGTGDSDTLTVLDASNTQRYVSLGTIPPRRTSPADYEVALANVASALRIREEREQAKQFARKVMPPPEWLPRYYSLHYDDAGLIWATVSAPADSITVLRGVSVDGRRHAELRFPLRFVVFDIGVDYVLGAYEDNEGAPHVVMYGFKRRMGV